MDKYKINEEEAKEYMIKHCNPQYPNGDTMWEQAINMSVKALEKQIFKKPLPVKLSIDGKKIIPCGNCSKDVEIYYNYCPWCGQRMDWSEQWIIEKQLEF